MREKAERKFEVDGMYRYTYPSQTTNLGNQKSEIAQIFALHLSLKQEFPDRNVTMSTDNKNSGEQQQQAMEKALSNDPHFQQAVYVLTKSGNKTEPVKVPPFQLNLQSYDKTDGSSRLDHTVLIGSNDGFTEEGIKGAKLSSIRALLMRKGALSLVG